MGLRLGFSVAAHLEPEILVIDEVLAVGDAEFQKRCLGKMSDVAGEGRTVLFVSHNLEAVLNLCSRCILLDRGSMRADGEPVDTIHLYNQSSRESRKNRAEPHVIYYDYDELGQPMDLNNHRILSIELLDMQRQPNYFISTWDDIVLRVRYYSPEEVSHGSLVLDIRDYKEQRLIVADSGSRFPLKEGEHFIDCVIPQIPLSAGDYYVAVGLAISKHRWLHRVEQAGELKIHGKDVFNLSRPPTTNRMLFAVPHSWAHS